MGISFLLVNICVLRTIIMDQQEIYQLMKYKRDELNIRLSNIKQDFESNLPADDVLFAIAHQTKVELAGIKKVIQNIEQGHFGICQQCQQKIDDPIVLDSVLKTHCSQCKKHI